MHIDDAIDRIAIASGPELDDIIRAAWCDHTNGRLTENEIEILDEAARTRREALQPRQPARRPELHPAKKVAPQASARRSPRAPDRQRSIERRRRLAASGPMPPALAAKFSTGELAVFKIVGDAVLHQGRCDLCMDEIAGRAGVCRRLAQTAIREAEALGLLLIQERRLSTTRNDTNIITIVSGEWLDWLRIGGKGGGCKSIPTTQHSDSFRRPHTVSRYRSNWRAAWQESATSTRERPRPVAVAANDPGGHGRPRC
jgi:hypothetical protein